MSWFADLIESWFDASDEIKRQELELELIAATVKYENWSKFEPLTIDQLDKIIRAESEMKIIQRKLERLSK